mgnify:CR=1 FL=1
MFSRHGYGVGWASDRLSALPKDALAGAPASYWELGTRDSGSYATFSDVGGPPTLLVRRGTKVTDAEETIDTAPISVNGLSSQRTTQVELAMPTGVVPLGASTVDVTIDLIRDALTFKIGATLTLTAPELDRATAQRLLES